jgi:Fur family peroxide stress response transcriptional regulator
MRIKRNADPIIADRPITAQRRLLLDILKEADGHLHVKELYRRAAERDREISLATVYRNLRLFKELGLVRETRLDDLRCYYEINRPSDHYHLVCTACGQVIDFESPLVATLIADVERTCGFHAEKAVLHLEGRCSGCRKG